MYLPQRSHLLNLLLDMLFTVDEVTYILLVTSSPDVYKLCPETAETFQGALKIEMSQLMGLLEG